MWDGHLKFMLNFYPSPCLNLLWLQSFLNGRRIGSPESNKLRNTMLPRMPA